MLITNYSTIIHITIITLLIAEKALLEQGKVLNKLKQEKEKTLYKRGESWSPADLVNLDIDIEQQESVYKELEKNVEGIKDYINTYLVK